jgi:hypothetical protein
MIPRAGPLHGNEIAMPSSRDESASATFGTMTWSPWRVAVSVRMRQKILRSEAMIGRT